MSNLTIEQVERYRKGCEEPTYWWAPNRSESKALCDLALAALRQPPEGETYNQWVEREGGRLNNGAEHPVRRAMMIDNINAMQAYEAGRKSVTRQPPADVAILPPLTS